MFICVYRSFYPNWPPHLPATSLADFISSCSPCVHVYNRGMIVYSQRRVFVADLTCAALSVPLPSVLLGVPLGHLALAKTLSMYECPHVLSDWESVRCYHSGITCRFRAPVLCDA